ncbi:hypothetical protein ABK040_010495 [Willaertia magna]
MENYHHHRNYNNNEESECNCCHPNHHHNKEEEQTTTTHDIALHHNLNNKEEQTQEEHLTFINQKAYLWPWYPFLETFPKQKHSKLPTPLHYILKNDNPYLFSGYRKLPINSIKQCIYSMFTLHNETLNIWTHFLPGCYFLYLTFFVTFQLYHVGKSFGDCFISVFYYLSGSLTYFLSAYYHLFRMNNLKSYHYCLTCDLRGIISLLSGANVWSAYYLLEGFQKTSFLFTVLSFVGYFQLWMWIPKMVTKRLTNQRTLYFSIYGTLGLTIILMRFYLQQHYIFNHEMNLFHLLKCVFYNDLDLKNISNTLPNGNLIYEVLFLNRLYFWLYVRTFSLLGLGMIIRSLKIPERFKPYIFDIFGSSHQIFHTLGALSTIINHFELFDLYMMHESSTTQTKLLAILNNGSK